MMTELMPDCLYTLDDITLTRDDERKRWKASLPNGSGWFVHDDLYTAITEDGYITNSPADWVAALVKETINK